jgi:signal transduction histidine kinase/ligand-binding sensor domain-containing protein
VILTVSRRIHTQLCASVAVVFACFAASAASPSWFTRDWQTDDGLPNNRVTAIAQGHDGYLWIGTAVGLARFDGLHFVDFPYANSISNEDQGVNDIVISHSGGLWIRTRSGQIVSLSPDFSRVSPVATNLPNSRPVTEIVDRGGDLWVAYQESIWRIKDGVGTEVSDPDRTLPVGFPGNFAEDSDGNIWVVKGNHVVVHREGGFETVTTTRYKPHLAAARTDGIWVLAGRQLLRCTEDNRVHDYGIVPADIHAGASTLMEDRSGAVWIGTTSDGLFRYERSGFERIQTSHPDILSLAEDREGDIWVGTAGGGLDRISRRSIHLESLDQDSSHVPVQSVCQDSNGVIWGASQNGLLVCRLEDKWVPAITNVSLPEPVTCVAADRRGGIWFGTREWKLYRLQDGQVSSWGATNGLAGRAVLALLPASTGDLWIAIYGPRILQCLHDGQLRSLSIPDNIGRITALAEDTSGRIWIGSEAGALMQVDGNQVVDKSSLMASSNRSILCLYPGSDGALWIGYEGAGLGRLENGTVSQVKTSQGLSDDYISQIVSDDEGWLWFGGERGIFKARRTDINDVMAGRANHFRSINYGQNEGLFSVEANSANINPYISPCALQSGDGRLWIPLRNSLAVVDPKVLSVTAKPPQPILTDVNVDGRIVASYGGLAATQTVANLMTSNVSLRLPPAHRHLEFNFSAINLSAPESVRFRYQLVGFDSDWTIAEKERTAVYSRLTPNDYQFRVEASVSDGPWNQTPAVLAFTVPAPFWQTWWFRIGALVVFTSCVIAVARYISLRRMHMEMRLLEQRAALDKERTRIARDLHDDLGCSLNKVALTLDMMQRGPDAVESGNGKIERCSTMVRQVAKSVDEIVWAINPRNDTLRYVVDYISQFAVEFLHAADISCRVDLPDHTPNLLVSPEARHNLFLVVKEALNNIVRHAHGSEVQLQIAATEEKIAIVIQDNGKGFEQVPDNASADGLRNMRQRMDEIGGRFDLDTKPGRGTRVTFSYSWLSNNGSNGNPKMPYPSAHEQG